MSADSLPITASRFATALTDLPLSSLYAKASELRNSIAHLQKSNVELQEWVEKEGDKDCYEAYVENQEVIKRMEERIEMVKKEVTEIRGLPWEPESLKTAERPAEIAGDAEMTDGERQAATRNGAAGAGGRQNGTSGAQEEEGVYL
ncbi:hypothetical protein K469DRAFT_246045 [Zopfia rhizophila CBS 207.26]|uniref:Uncharacterized protein n=1 Tax=Zopfia rhizophila CBS 207.26 TaxID=1314779 RepID=A0A6A6DVH1_9PEZI|nr:hypothetical protein K469DRAFT_246045 [Zopfia rhizophila CBS 207.26]